MATIKAYSVAQTEKQFGGAAVQSSVYSRSQGRNGAYDHPTTPGLTEGRIKTLVNGSRAAVDHDVTAISARTEGSGGPASTQVVATTTTTSGTGAGLIVSFQSTAGGGVAAAGSVTVVDGGEGYSTGNTVSVDGFPGSSLTVTAA